MCIKKVIHTTPVVSVILVGIFCGLAAQSWASDPNETPALEEGFTMAASYAAGSTYTNLVETTYDDSDWILVVSDVILRENLCYSGRYDKPFNPCYDYNRYWEMPSDQITGEAFPMDIIGKGTSDGLYVRAGYYFQLFSNVTKPDNSNDLIPYGPRMIGPKYVSVDHWQAGYEFEPDTFFVEGEAGGLKDYSIIIYTYDPNMLTKTSDVEESECRFPNEQITYSICYNNNSNRTLEDAFVIDWLPDGVDYPAGIDHYVFDGNSIVLVEGDPNYNSEEHYYRWELDDIAPDQSLCFELEVTVNSSAEPGIDLENIAELWIDSGESLVSRAIENTHVCCWDDPNILYVDHTAEGLNNGMTWQDAYTDLAYALTRIHNSDCKTGPFNIYVAQGTYDPNETPDKTFDLPDNCSVYGGFPSGGGDFNKRNPKQHKTILTGLIDDDAFPDSSIMVTMGDETLLDGFTITQALEQAIYGNGVDFTVTHCTIEETFGYGIYAKNGNASVQWCTIKLNSVDGIRHDGKNSVLSVNNSWMLRNGECGIRCEYSTPIVKNSIVSESDLTQQGRAGVRLLNPSSTPVLHNLTISNNREAGIYFADDRTISDPNDKDYPDLQNTIVYYNNPEGSQIIGFNPDTYANFCCIQDCNEPGTTNFNDEPMFAYAVDPNGTPDPNNYHLAHNSRCIDEANPYLDYSDQVDIDGEGLDRKYGNFVDIGADEVYDCDDDYISEADVHNDYDWDADGQINLVEFSAFSRAWLSHNPNDPAWIANPNIADPNLSAAWNPKCNLEDMGDSQYTIDLADLETFISDAPWCWIACWKLEQMTAAAVATAQTESMSAESLSMSSMSLNSCSLESETTIEIESKVSIEALVQIIGILDYEIIPERPDNVGDIEEMRADLMDDLKEAWLNENQ